MLRTDIINLLIDKLNYASYLEIGVDNAALNFDQIQCLHKDGVDPDPKAKATFEMTSDAFFAMNKKGYDLIFIDGLHHANQVYKDVNNALDILNKGGTIVMHDCNPPSYNAQLVPRIQELWTGDVWKAWLRLRTNKNLSMYVVDTDWGVGVLRPGEQEALEEGEISYNDLNQDRSRLLNLVSEGEFLLKVTDDVPGGKSRGYLASKPESS